MQKYAHMVLPIALFLVIVWLTRNFWFPLVIFVLGYYFGVLEGKNVPDGSGFWYIALRPFREILSFFTRLLGKREK